MIKTQVNKYSMTTRILLMMFIFMSKNSCNFTEKIISLRMRRIFSLKKKDWEVL